MTWDNNHKRLFDIWLILSRDEFAKQSGYENEDDSEFLEWFEKHHLAMTFPCWMASYGDNSAWCEATSREDAEATLRFQLGCEE